MGQKQLETHPQNGSLQAVLFSWVDDLIIETILIIRHMDATLYHGDCLQVMPTLEPQFDMILCDLPYGTTACNWDQIIPFEPLWEQYKRLIKPNGAIVLFASQPFTTDLICSNKPWFKFLWYWEKNTSTGIALAKNQPMRCIEEVAVFCSGKPTYNKQPARHRTKVFQKNVGRTRKGRSNHCSFDLSNSDPSAQEWVNPINVLKFDSVPQCHRTHPTEKPVDLLKYLIKTHSNEGELILDNTMGSGSTGVAAILNGRRFVGIEKEQKYFEIAQRRIEQAQQEVGSMLIKPWEVEPAKPQEHTQPTLFDGVESFA